ncbi:MAG: hypothetical protein QOJ73_587 [Streptosporangiaceae bacterium]|nr:hypothetical protein [Streptosporangiaceae bacterium]
MTAAHDTPSGALCDPQEHDTAERIECGNPRWAIIWGTHSRRYFAFPRFTAAPGTIITAPATTELLDRMRHAELSARTRHP